MRLIVLVGFLVACGSPSSEKCAAPHACGSAPAPNYRFCSADVSTGCYYQLSDGSRLQCRSCDDCTDAQSLADSWCENAPPTDLGDDNVVAIHDLSPATICTNALCPGGKANYKFCSKSGAVECWYLGADGSRFECASCSDCQTAANQTANWCAAQ